MANTRLSQRNNSRTLVQHPTPNNPNPENPTGQNAQNNQNTQNPSQQNQEENQNRDESSHHNEEVNQNRPNPPLDAETLRTLIADAVDGVMGNLESRINEITMRKQREDERHLAAQKAGEALEAERLAATKRIHKALDREIEEQRFLANQRANAALDRVASRVTARPPVIIERPAQSAPGSRSMLERLGPRSHPQPPLRAPVQTRLGSRAPIQARLGSRAPIPAPARTHERSRRRGNRSDPVDISEEDHRRQYEDYEEEPREEHSDEVNSSLNLNDIARRVAQINQGNNQQERVPGLAPSPIVPHIRDERLRVDEDIPKTVPGYDGTGCPYEHRRQFESRVTLYGYTEDLMARLFAMSLVGHASSWFYSLKAESIGSYGQLVEEFTAYFKTNKHTSESSSSLFSIRQRKDETLREYIRRFNVAALRVTDLDLRRRKEILHRTLRSAKVKESIIMHAGDTMEGLGRVLEKSCELEDIEQQENTELESIRETPRAPLGRKEQRARSPQRPRSPRRARSPLPPTDLRRDIERNRNDNYVNPFKHPLRKVYSLIKNESYVPRPKPLRNTENIRNSRDFCEYQMQKGHTTKRCFHLRKLLGQLLEMGYLREYLNEHERREERQRSRTPPRKGNVENQVNQLPPPPPRPEWERSPRRNDTIFTISGGPAEGDSRNARERIAKILHRPPANPVRVYSLRKIQQTNEPITFAEDEYPFDYEFGETEPDFPLVVTMKIANQNVRRILIDTGSSANIITTTALHQLEIPNFEVKRCNTSLIGFNGIPVKPVGIVRLVTTVGEGNTAKTRDCSYVVVDTKFEYNVIIGRAGQNALGLVCSTAHLKVKWQTMYGVGQLCGDRQDAWRCYQEAINKVMAIPKRMEPVQSIRRANEPVPEILRPRDKSITVPQGEVLPDALNEKICGPAPPRMEPESFKSIPLDIEDPSRKVRIGTELETATETMLITFLRERASTFAWSTDDLVGIDPSVAEHRLNIFPNTRPIRQKRRIHGEEKDKAIAKEVLRLLMAGHIVELFYAECLCNVVMVIKSTENGETIWRMCVDFTDLNRHCPKDCYLLPSIDQLVDSTAGCELLSMMDASQGYYQVPMALEDRPKTAFITNEGVYVFNVMPFGLKNAGATYQRLVNRMFHGQIGRTMEVYLDDMLVKSHKAADHLTDLEQCFDTLDRYHMKLNPKKCTFGVKGGKFLGYVVSERGIEANPEKIKAILELPSPTTLKEVQQMVGKLIVVNRFISRSAERNLPFFKLFRKSNLFEWTSECEQAFQNVKSYLASPPLLAKTQPGDTLYLYIAVGAKTISSVLVREEGGTQAPVYYLSRILTSAERNYLSIEKAALSVVHCARKQRHYFQSYKIVVVTNYPLRQAFSSFLRAGRMVKWAVELGEHEIEYVPRRTIRAQVLADLLISEEDLEPPKDSQPEVQVLTVTNTPPWIVTVDGASNGAKAGIGITIRNPDGILLEYAIHLDFPATNNEAEYEAAIIGLEMARAAKADRVCLFIDSDLVKKQITGEYLIHETALVKYNEKLKESMGKFESCTIEHLVRAQNDRADALSKFAIRTREVGARTITLTTAPHPSIQSDLLKRFSVMTIAPMEKWISDISLYLADNTLPEDKNEARNLKFRATRYELIDGVLYKRGFNNILLRCLGKTEAEDVLEQVHRGHCGNHSGHRSLLNKILRAGYFWITMNEDCYDYVKKCDNCQRFAKYIHCPSRPARQLVVCCPFDIWGIDIIGPFPIATGQRKYILLAVDQYSKFVEAEALPKITSARVVQFL